MSLGSMYWNARFSSWGEAAPARDGYSLLMPVPGDLPVFLEIALTVCALQDAQHRVETVVLPDRPTSQVHSVVERHRRGWGGDLRLELLPLPERFGLPLLRNPSHNHGIQLITGIGAARGSHILLHDADLFLLREHALDRHYERTVADDDVVAGVDPVWDTWFAERGFSLVATWEMCARRDWLRAFPPHMHMGHEAEILGEPHVFDTTLHAQALTDASRIALHEDPEGIAHFNYVISTYRHFQRSSGSFVDERFRLLLVRLFIDLFAREPYDYRLPDHAQLSDGLTRADAPVSYPAPDDGTEEFRRFREKFDRILSGAWVSEQDRERAREALRPFDSHYA